MDQQKIKKAQQTLDSDCSEFSATDPFNPQNYVEGQISFSRDRRYGAMLIRKISGEPADQPLILSTPKIAYPFGLGHNYRFPSAERIYRFRKYDGTNIFMYRYKNNGREYITFKVRLFPFLRGPLHNDVEAYPSQISTDHRIVQNESRCHRFQF